jgi:HNH endonuclease
MRLVALCTSGAPGEEGRAEVVMSADLAALGSDRPGCELDRGPVLHPELARRIACDCRLQVVLRDKGGKAVGIGRRSRTVPEWIMRELTRRDGGCSFPRCGTRHFVAAHHIVHWARGGATDLDNLVLVCSFHHKLVHEGGWQVTLRDDHEAAWLRPNGRSYEPRLPNLPEVVDTS